MEAGVAALGGGPAWAAVGPAVGPCCYEVGPEVSERFDPDLTRDGILDLWTAAERALRRAGVERVERVDLLHALQPGAVLLPPSQRPGARRSGSDRCCRRLSSASATSGCAPRSGPGVTVVAATKYVALADMAALVEAGIEVVGENRVQDLEASTPTYGDAFRWHFIGRLQSNKVKVVNRDLRARPLARLALGGASGSRCRRSCR